MSTNSYVHEGWCFFLGHEPQFGKGIGGLTYSAVPKYDGVPSHSGKSDQETERKCLYLFSGLR